MHRRTVGIVFIGFAVFMFSTRYMAAAIWASNMNSWNQELFRQVLDAMGEGLAIASWFALLAGVSYLILAEFLDFHKKKGEEGQQHEPRSQMLKQIKENWQQEFDDDHSNNR